eukprot:TRINITY_DN3014_c0_g1_i2.p1 TRINITY_DN3014_c0_g1~~TRINITY_DN3014_c0_g1_i2.p1  ORF type:complete len:336 (-),score=21.54 TRINITY_DN3014_c0_g1_i2:287-1258(-)
MAPHASIVGDTTAADVETAPHQGDVKAHMCGSCVGGDGFDASILSDSKQTCAASKQRTLQQIATAPPLATVSHTIASAEACKVDVVVLDLNEPTVQTSETACWLLSIIEGLRSSGHLHCLFERNVVVTMDGLWRTAAGRTGRAIGDDSLPRWQQVLESIFAHRHPGCSARGGFQEAVPPAMGMGMSGRAAAIQAYFQLVRSDVRVSCKLITPRIGLPRESLANFLNVNSQSGLGEQSVRVLVAQVHIEGSERAHAIAVHEAAFDGKRLVLHTYDQKFEETGAYTILCGAMAKQKCFTLPTCPWKDGTQTQCDGVVSVIVSGFP